MLFKKTRVISVLIILIILCVCFESHREIGKNTMVKRSHNTIFLKWWSVWVRENQVQRQKILDALTDNDSLRWNKLDEKDRRIACDLMKHHTPIAYLISRNTRAAPPFIERENLTRLLPLEMWKIDVLLFLKKRTRSLWRGRGSYFQNL